VLTSRTVRRLPPFRPFLLPSLPILRRPLPLTHTYGLPHHRPPPRIPPRLRRLNLPLLQLPLHPLPYFPFNSRTRSRRRAQIRRGQCPFYLLAPPFAASHLACARPEGVQGDQGGSPRLRQSEKSGRARDGAEVARQCIEQLPEFGVRPGGCYGHVGALDDGQESLFGRVHGRGALSLLSPSLPSSFSSLSSPFSSRPFHILTISLSVALAVHSRLHLPFHSRFLHPLPHRRLPHPQPHSPIPPRLNSRMAPRRDHKEPARDARSLAGVHRCRWRWV
jgi:hypothetical protein